MNKNAEFRFSSFIIAMLVVGAVATTFTMTTANLSSKYGTAYDNETLEAFQDTASLNNLTTELESKTNSQNVESGVLDVVGLYIGRALDAIKLSVSSFSVFESMATASAEKTGAPGYFLTTIITIMLVLIIFAIIAVMVKWLV